MKMDPSVLELREDVRVSLETETRMSQWMSQALTPSGQDSRVPGLQERAREAGLLGKGLEPSV